jgi:hypothetical protein
MMTFFRLAAQGVVLAGCVLLARAFYLSLTGQHAQELFPGDVPSRTMWLFALCLSLPVPLHVISVGLIIQRKWLTPLWSRIAWFAVVLSGCWLGIALVIKLFIL